MKRLFSRLPKKVLGLVAAAVAFTGLAATATAWYPDRPTYTTAHPADHVTFNSITDNPREGDERAFFEVKDAANTQSDGFAHKAVVKDGQELLLRVYVHNNAADNLNGTNFDGVGVAKNTQVRVWLPSVTDDVMRLNAYVSADNATPKVVSDTLDLAAPTTSQKFSISYVPGSAVAYNNAVGQSGMKLSDSIVAGGAKIGYKQADGIVPGCFKYVNVITLKVKVHMPTPSFTVEKKVALPGTSWSKSITAKPGQKVKYEIAFKNTGSKTLEHVVARDIMPKNVKIVPGSTKLYNSNAPNGSDAGSDAVVSDGGIDIGAYTAGANAFVVFEATLPSADQLTCGNNKLTNTAQVITGGIDSTDTADVNIPKECQTETPVYSCDLLDLSVDKESRSVTVTKFQTTQKNGATFKNAVINWGDTSANLTTNTAVGQKHTYAKDGTYTVTATAHCTVNGKDASDTGAGCAKAVTFTSTPPPVTPPVTPPTPPTLVNTGPGEVLGMFAAITVAGAIAHRLFLTRRFAR
jgi:uncharacterized repeat protein (TIGR01451 family)